MGSCPPPPPSTVSPRPPPVLRSNLVKYSLAPKTAMGLPSIAHAHVCQDGEQCWGAEQGGGSCPCGVYWPRVTQGEATHSRWGPGWGGGVAVARALAPKAQPTCEGPAAPSRGQGGPGPQEGKARPQGYGGHDRWGPRLGPGQTCILQRSLWPTQGRQDTRLGWIWA